MHLRARVGLPAHQNQLFGVCGGNGTEKHAINQAENCSIQSYSQREGENNAQSKTRRFAQYAPGITHVLAQRIKESVAMHLAQRLASLSQATESNQRLKNIQFSLRLISFWLMLIFVVLIIEYGDDVRAALKEWFSVIGTMLKG